MNTKNYSILMNAFNKKEKREFLLKFNESGALSSFKDTFSGITGKGAEWILLDPAQRPVKNKIKYDRSVLKTLPKKIQVFYSKQNKICLCIPLTQGNNNYGYLLVLDLKYEPEKKDLTFMRYFIDIALKEFQKEQELTKLYDTIRPRAIALSTIHTIHRLLSSTLDMSELIERIARLTLQVMRARHCSIMLLDESRKYLVPRAVIDLKNNTGKVQRRHRKIRIGMTAAGKVAKAGKTILSRNSIYVPLVEEDIIGVICAKNKANNMPFNNFDMEILLTLAEQAVIAIRNAQLYEEQKRMAYGSIKSLAMLLDLKSPEIYTHSEKFVKIVMAIAEEMRLRREDVVNLRYAALLPDTGRFTIPDEIFKKCGTLSRKEYEVIKKRHLESLKILEPLDFLKPAMPIIIHHHERYDGTGYPDGLKGQRIPIGARIMAVADAFEAMISSRPYKQGKITIAQAIKEIEHNKGTQFDPDVVDAFISITKKPEFKGLF